MTQLVEQEAPPSAVAPYARGVPAEVVARGLVGRFIPASAGIMTAMALIPILSEPRRTGIVLSIMTMETASVIVGYGAALAVMRRWLYPDAGIDGRRSVVAGLFSPLALGIASLFFQGRGEMIVPTSILAGAGMALVLYFPWLRPTPGKTALMAPDDTRA